jgi:threonine/homoserine/homoserine lactone efflux protein
VLTNAIGELLPAAMAVALSPFPIIAIVLLLATPRARANGAAFTLGWVVGLAALTTIALLVSEGSDAADGTSATWIDWLRVVGGALMLVLAGKKWRTRPRAGEQVPMPGWMKSFETASPRRSLVLGLGLAGVNFKNIALAGSAASSITDLVADGHDVVVSAAVFVVLGSLSVLGALVYFLVGGSRAAAPLERVKEFMLANNSVIMMVILLLLGANILGNGIAAVGS